MKLGSLTRLLAKGFFACLVGLVAVLGGASYWSQVVLIVTVMVAVDAGSAVLRDEMEHGRTS